MSLIDRIREKSIQTLTNKKSLFSKFLEIEQSLLKALGDLELHADSKRVTLEQVGSDDWIYGYVYFSKGLKVAYRSTEEDYMDAMSNVPEECWPYRNKDISTCSVDWLHKLLSEKAIESLMVIINEKLESMDGVYKASFNSLDNLLDKESHVVANDVIEGLKEINAENLLGAWLKARNTIETDPSDSVTRSSSYLESVCRKILDDRNIPLPSKKDMSPLIAATLDALNNPQDKIAKNDTDQLMGSIKGLFQGVGTIRTHFGTAHGPSADSFVMDEIYARLVSDAAATASVFLLKLHKNNK